MLEGVKLSNVNWTCYAYKSASFILRMFLESPWKVLKFDFDKLARTMFKVCAQNGLPLASTQAFSLI